MAFVEIRDQALWPKHIHGDSALKSALMSLPKEGLVELEVAGFRGVWKRSRSDHYPEPTPGFSPLGMAEEHWRALTRDHRGEEVTIALVRTL